MLRILSCASVGARRSFGVSGVVQPWSRNIPAMRMPAHTHRLSVISPQLAWSNGMGLQKHGFGEFSEKLLVDFRVPNHFHMLFTRRNILVIGLAISLPYDTVEHNAYFL